MSEDIVFVFLRKHAVSINYATKCSFEPREELKHNYVSLGRLGDLFLDGKKYDGSKKAIEINNVVFCAVDRESGWNDRFIIVLTGGRSYTLSSVSTRFINAERNVIDTFASFLFKEVIPELRPELISSVTEKEFTQLLLQE